MKKRILAFLSVIATTVILTSCGNNSATNTGNVQDVGSKPITLTFMNHTGETKTINYENDLIKQFEEEHPNIKIEVQRMGMDDYNQTVQAKFASGDSPDIFIIEPTNLERYVANEYLMDLSETTIVDNYKTENLLKHDGKVYGTPISANAYLITYNKAVFQSAGVEIPTTMDELYQVCEQLQKAGYIPFAAGYQDSWVVMADAQAEYNSGVLAKDHDALTKLESREATFSESEEWRGVFERMGKRLEYSQGDEFGTDWSTACTMLATEKAAMIVSGDWTSNNLADMGENIELGAFILPISNEAENNILAYSGLNMGYVISSSCKEKEIAVEFLTFFTSKEAGDAYVKNNIGICVIDGVEAPEGESALTDIIKIMNTDKEVPLGDTLVNFNDEYRDAFQNVVSSFLLEGGSDIDKVCAELDAEFDRISGN